MYAKTKVSQIWPIEKIGSLMALRRRIFCLPALWKASQLTAMPFETWINAWTMEVRPDYFRFAKSRKRWRSVGSVLKTPVNWVVMVETWRWWTPLVDMHW